MNQLQKYIWLINTIRRAGKISLKELSDKWERVTELNEGNAKKLHRSTLNHWRDAILEQFGIIIDCQQCGAYGYFIANPEEIDDDRLKKWMLDSYAVGTVIGENLSLKDRILVDEIPSGREHLTTILEAMRDNRIVGITYRPFGHDRGYEFPIAPYCVKLFENRWYVLARNNRDELRLYGLDRFEAAELTGEKFRMPRDFDAESYFATNYGIVADRDMKPERIVLRANADHKHYLRSLPLHHSQRLLEECDRYADFELYLAPTYDFVMKLLQTGAMIEVLRPASLRRTMKNWISEMYGLYKND